MNTINKVNGNETTEVDRFFKFFKVNGEDRDFMYLYGTTDKGELQQFIDFVKGQGDIYRITQYKGHYIIWDARI